MIICIDIKPTEKQLAALTHLWSVARTDTRQSKRIAKFLLNLWGVNFYKFDMTDFRCLDKHLFDDSMLILEVDYSPNKPIYEYLNISSELFVALANHHTICPYAIKN